MARILQGFMLSVILVWISGVADAAIGIYKWPRNDQACPAAITYMLNTDANASDAWAVQIEICPVSGETLGSPVRTYSYPAGDPMCARGLHSISWDGYLADGLTQAPLGQYRARITAKAAPVTGTDVIPLWESTSISTSAMRDAGVNKNPNSDYYGYVYAVNAVTKHVYMFEPDGSAYTTFAAKSANNWNGSAPWGVDIATDDSAWVTSYTGSWLSQFTPTGSSRLYEGQPMASAYRNPRYMAVQGPGIPGTPYTGSDFRVVESFGTYPATGRLFVWNGSEPPSATFTEVNLDVCPQEPEFLSNGDIAVCAYANAGAATTGGLLQKYSITGAKVSENPNIHRGVGLAISPDGQYVYVSRCVVPTVANYADADSTPIYKINAATAFTTAAPGSADVVSLGLQCAGASKRAYTLECDKVGNLVAATGVTNPITLWDATHVGVYAAPDSGSTDSRVTGIINWDECHPTVVSTNSGVQIPMCNGSGTVEVVASDCDGYADIQGVYLDLTPFGGDQFTPMERTAYDSEQATYHIAVSAPAGTSVGEYTLNVALRDNHYPKVPDTAGTAKVMVIGGWITGKVTVDHAGWGVAGATVTATDGINTFTAITDANGNYAINASLGTYTVNAAKGTGYASITDTTPVDVTCAQATANIDRKLGPTDIRTCTGGNYYQFPGRLMGDDVCIIGTVYRAPAIAGVQPGFDGYYYIYDNLYQDSLQAVKISNYTSQMNLKEGDKVIVEGTWSFIGGGSGYFQGYVNPKQAPHFVSANNALPSPTAFSMIQRNYSYGRLFSNSGKVLEVRTDRFLMEAPTGGSSVAPEIWVVMRSLASTGVTLPAVNDFVEVKGILSHIESFEQNVLCPAKPSDVRQASDVFINPSFEDGNFTGWTIYGSALPEVKTVGSGGFDLLPVEQGAADGSFVAGLQASGGIKNGGCCQTFNAPSAGFVVIAARSFSTDFDLTASDIGCRVRAALVPGAATDPSVVSSWTEVLWGPNWNDIVLQVPSAGQYTLFIDHRSGSDGIWSGLWDDVRFSNAVVSIVNGPSVSGITEDSATVSWETDLVSTTELRYDQNGPPYDHTVTGQEGNLHSITLTGLTMGTVYHYSVKSQAVASFPAESTDQVFQTLCPPPTIQITSPSPDQPYSTIHPTINISGTANVSVVAVRWSNDKGGSGTCTGTTAWTVESIPLQEGTNVITITASNAINETASATLTVIYDGTAPVVNITSPTADPAFSSTAASIDLSGTATDEHGVLNVTWSSDRGGSGTCSGTTSWSISGIALSEGTNTITITASDAAGNSGTDTLTVICPRINITNGHYYEAVPGDISWSAAKTAAEQMTYQGLPGYLATVTSVEENTFIAENLPDAISGGYWLGGYQDPASTTDPSSAWRWVTVEPWNYTNWGSGEPNDYYLSQGFTEDALAFYWGGGGAWNDVPSDPSSITGNKPHGYVVEYEPDNVAPVVDITTPTQENTYATTSATVDIAGTASDNVGVVSVTWINDRGGNGTCSGTSSWHMTGIALLPGINRITIAASDTHGNWGTCALTVTRAPISIGQARTMPSRTQVYVGNALVTAASLQAGVTFVESSDRSAGIKLITSQPLQRGQSLELIGIVDRIGGEYQISDIIPESIKQGILVTPLAVTTRTIGNDPTQFLEYTGINTTGLLVRFTGTVSGRSTIDGVMYVDDGYRYQDGVLPIRGIRVKIPSGITIPSTGKRVTVTGISRVLPYTLPDWREVNGDWYPPGMVVYIPQIWIRDSADLQVY